MAKEKVESMKTELEDQKLAMKEQQLELRKQMKANELEYRKQLEQMEQYKKVKDAILENREELEKAVKKATDKFRNDVYYYITGSPAFVGRLSGLLEKFNISSVRIKYDRFKGY